MSKISEKIFETGLMTKLLADLTEEEIIDLEKYIDEFVQPFDDFSFLIADMMSTDTSREKLAEDIIKIFTPEGIEELEKCLEKS